MENKEKRKEYDRKYYLQNKERRKEYLKHYRLQNKKKKKKWARLYYLQNKEKIKEKHKEYYLKNKERIKEYFLKNKDKINKQRNRSTSNRKKTDVNYKLSCNLRARLYLAVKNNYKSGSAVKDLGCSIDYFKRYLESQFKKGMSWNNYGKWEIDHQIPLSIVDLTKRDNLLQICHYTNLQPMWKEENIRKGKQIV